LIKNCSDTHRKIPLISAFTVGTGDAYMCTEGREFRLQIVVHVALR